MTSTHKHHIISIQYPSQKCLPEKSCLDYLRILIMSWLFNDPINSNLAQFDHAQSNSKKWPKGEKDQIPPNDFFSRKTTNKIFMYLSAPFVLQNFKKQFLELIQSYLYKMYLYLNKNFLVQTIIITFIYLMALFIVENLKKLLPQIQSYEDVLFLGPKWTTRPKFFFWKLLISFSSTY